jgi:hypothetical protein
MHASAECVTTQNCTAKTTEDSSPLRVTEGGASTLLGFFQVGCSFCADATQPLPPASSSFAEGRSPYRLMMLLLRNCCLLVLLLLLPECYCSGER